MTIALRKVRPNWTYAERTDNETTEAAHAVLPDRGEEDHDDPEVVASTRARDHRRGQRTCRPVTFRSIPGNSVRHACDILRPHGWGMPKRKTHRKQPSGRTAFDRDVELYLANDLIDHIADYASRGRSHKRLTDDQLSAKWIAAFRNFADDRNDRGRRAIEMDLKAEFHLRNIEPPYDLVKPEIVRVVEDMSSNFEKMKRDDPDAVDEMSEEMEYDLADLKARMKRSN